MRKLTYALAVLAAAGAALVPTAATAAPADVTPEKCVEGGGFPMPNPVGRNICAFGQYGGQLLLMPRAGS